MRNFFNLLIIVCCLFFTTQAISKTLSLNEAILLAVRMNPNVKNIQLSDLIQKFNLHIQKWQFYPHYSLEASVNSTNGISNGNPMAPSKSIVLNSGVSLNTPIGTVIDLYATNSKVAYYNPGLSLQVTQPLMRGFGKPIVEAALQDAKESVIISRLSVEATVRATITAVINAYLDVLSAQRTYQIDQKALMRAKKSVEHTQLFIKAGRKARNEIITVKADLAGVYAKLEDDKNNLSQVKNALLMSIGIDPNQSITFSTLDIDQLISNYHVPSLVTIKKNVLENDIQYQTDLLMMNGSIKRNILIAEDNTRWILNLQGTIGTGKGVGGGFNAGINSLFNGTNQSQSIGLQLKIPIDDQVSKQSVLSAKIALKKAEIEIQREKWSKELMAVNSFNTIMSAKRMLSFAKDAATLQEQTYQISYQKYIHGLIDSLELQSAQFRLISAEESLLKARINFLKSLVNLDELMGHTLKTWHINMRLK